MYNAYRDESKPYCATGQERQPGAISAEALRDGAVKAPKAPVAPLTTSWTYDPSLPPELHIALMVACVEREILVEETNRRVMAGFVESCKGTSTYPPLEFRTVLKGEFLDGDPTRSYTLEPSWWARIKLLPFVLWHSSGEWLLLVLALLLWMSVTALFLWEIPRRHAL